jgi:hypothetical protein
LTASDSSSFKVALPLPVRFIRLARGHPLIEDIPGVDKTTLSLRQISNTYITLRYSPDPAAVVLNRFAKEVSQFAAHIR